MFWFHSGSRHSTLSRVEVAAEGLSQRRQHLQSDPTALDKWLGTHTRAGSRLVGFMSASSSIVSCLLHSCFPHLSGEGCYRFYVSCFSCFTPFLLSSSSSSSTESVGWHCSPPDLNRRLRTAVFPSRTASSGRRCSLSDLNRQLWTAVFPTGP